MVASLNSMCKYLYHQMSGSWCSAGTIIIIIRINIIIIISSICLSISLISMMMIVIKLISGRRCIWAYHMPWLPWLLLRVFSGTIMPGQIVILFLTIMIMVKIQLVSHLITSDCCYRNCVDIYTTVTKIITEVHTAIVGWQTNYIYIW